MGVLTFEPSTGDLLTAVGTSGISSTSAYTSANNPTITGFNVSFDSTTGQTTAGYPLASQITFAIMGTSVRASIIPSGGGYYTGTEVNGGTEPAIVSLSNCLRYPLVVAQANYSLNGSVQTTVMSSYFVFSTGFITFDNTTGTVLSAQGISGNTYTNSTGSTSASQPDKPTITLMSNATHSQDISTMSGSSFTISAATFNPDPISNNVATVTAGGQVAHPKRRLLQVADDSSMGYSITYLNYTGNATATLSNFTIITSFASLQSLSLGSSSPLSFSAVSSSGASSSLASSSVTSPSLVSSSTAGSAVSDPEFHGFWGQSFMVGGDDGLVYNIISDVDVQVNSLFITLSNIECPAEAAESVKCANHTGSYFGELYIHTANGDELHVRGGPVKVGFASVQISGTPLLEGQSSGVPVNGAVHTLHHSTYSAAQGGSQGISEADHLGRQSIYAARLSSRRLEVHAGVYEMVIENSDRYVDFVQVRISCWDCLHTLQPEGLLGRTWERNATLPPYEEHYREQDSDIRGNRFNNNKFTANTQPTPVGQ